MKKIVWLDQSFVSIFQRHAAWRPCCMKITNRKLQNFPILQILGACVSNLTGAIWMSVCQVSGKPAINKFRPQTDSTLIYQCPEATSDSRRYNAICSNNSWSKTQYIEVILIADSYSCRAHSLLWLDDGHRARCVWQHVVRHTTQQNPVGWRADKMLGQGKKSGTARNEMVEHVPSFACRLMKW